MITQEQAEAALESLGNTDGEYGRRKARVEGLRETRKIVKAQMMLEIQAAIGPGEKMSGQMIEANAYASPTYRKEVDDLIDAIRDFEILKAKRLSGELKIEVWRSIHSAQKKGIV